MNPLPAVTARERVLGGLWGALVGDALGVPVEFKDRATVQADPVTDMRGYGSHKQPAGTWSDDGALTLCTVDSLLNSDFDTNDMGHRFVRWMNEDYWTATGVVFDIGLATTDALMRIASGTPAERAGRDDEHSNGNGSLMRILPVAFRFAGEPLEKLASRCERASAITHGHARSKMACVFHALVVRELLMGDEPAEAIETARTEFNGLYKQAPDLPQFRHILEEALGTLPEAEVVSTGYVMHTLHASLWCLCTTSTFDDCVLKAVNLGGDTDTTGCVAGGLAGAHYGLRAIPQVWLEALPRHNEVESLFSRFSEKVCSSR